MKCIIKWCNKIEKTNHKHKYRESKFRRLIQQKILKSKNKITVPRSQFSLFLTIVQQIIITKKLWLLLKIKSQICRKILAQEQTLKSNNQKNNSLGDNNRKDNSLRESNKIRKEFGRLQLRKQLTHLKMDKVLENKTRKTRLSKRLILKTR